MKYIISIDQSTSATKAMLFDTATRLHTRVSIEHKQYYPHPGWMEHDPEEIWINVCRAIKSLLAQNAIDASDVLSLAITNQRETVVVWDKYTGRPIYNAIVWQCSRGTDICNQLVEQGYESLIEEKTGLIINPYFSASGVKWILDNVANAREAAEQGELLMGTIDSWLIWKLTGGRVHATDYTNASRTLLFNLHTLEWDEDLLQIFTIPRSMMPQLKACDTVFGETTVEGMFPKPIPIAGVLGDSHGALVGQMCFTQGMGKATYGTGSSVMINIGDQVVKAPKGLVTSVGFAACDKVFYAFEGNIHCTGATIKWLVDNLQLIENPAQIEQLALTVPDNGGVYLVPAFAGLGAPWWNPSTKAVIYGMTLGSGIGHICRAALEAIAYQVRDLVDLVTTQAELPVKELRVDGGPTKNRLLMQFQADMLDICINRSDIEEASALGAMLMSGLALKLWSDFSEISRLRTTDNRILPNMNPAERQRLYEGWIAAVNMINL